jgi:hypothetical protein
VLARPTCTLAANIFDPLSARIAHLLGYEVCVCRICLMSSSIASASPVLPR